MAIAQASDVAAGFWEIELPSAEGMRLEMQWELDRSIKAFDNLSDYLESMQKFNNGEIEINEVLEMPSWDDLLRALRIMSFVDSEKLISVVGPHKFDELFVIRIGMIKNLLMNPFSGQAPLEAAVACK